MEHEDSSPSTRMSDLLSDYFGWRLGSISPPPRILQNFPITFSKFSITARTRRSKTYATPAAQETRHQLRLISVASLISCHNSDFVFSNCIKEMKANGSHEIREVIYLRNWLLSFRWLLISRDIQLILFLQTGRSGIYINW